MKAILNLEGSNNGSAFLNNYVGKTIDLESVWKDVSVDCPPLAKISAEDGKKFDLQLVDVRFVDQHIFIYGYVINNLEKSGGKVLLRFTPVV
jgi:hypothetical protein